MSNKGFTVKSVSNDRRLGMLSDMLVNASGHASDMLLMLSDAF